MKGKGIVGGGKFVRVTIGRRTLTARTSHTVESKGDMQCNEEYQ